MKLEINVFKSNTEISRSLMGYVQAVLHCMLPTRASFQLCITLHGHQDLNSCCLYGLTEY
jgi:hypothetical protein